MLLLHSAVSLSDLCGMAKLVSGRGDHMMLNAGLFVGIAGAPKGSLGDAAIRGRDRQELIKKKAMARDGQI